MIGRLKYEVTQNQMKFTIYAKLGESDIALDIFSTAWHVSKCNQYFAKTETHTQKNKKNKQKLKIKEM